uniref:Peptidase M3A/M3B catalytic domain-containing protein n=1 Tax=Romanomermis culicivorax TaxID=13658 RepID=A0A915JWU7_ROMCU
MKTFKFVVMKFCRRFFSKCSRSFRLRDRSYSTGLFGLNELKSPFGFEILEEKVYKECDQLIEESLSHSRNRKMVEIFDDLSNCICKVADLAECMRNLHPVPQYANAAEECMSRLSGFVENLLIEGNKTDRRVASLFASDFEASGVHLPEKQRQKFVALSEEIFRAGASFCRGCDLPVQIPKQRSPSVVNSKDYFLTRLKINGTNDSEQVVYIYGNNADSFDAEGRALGYKLYYSPSDEQEFHLKRLLKSRHELADISGFTSYAHRSLRDCIFDKPEDVDDFLTSLIKLIKPKAELEIEYLRNFLPSGEEICIYDIPYLKSVYRSNSLSSLTPKLSRSFDIQSTFMGISLLTKTLYNLTLRKEPVEDGEVWHPDVEKVIAYDENGKICGTIYCDWFDRQLKTASDSHFTVRCGKRLPNGDYQTPIVVLTFRYSKKRTLDGQAFNLIDYTNILHEFGHAMHSILGQTTYQHVSGTRCATDYAETPSNLMEFYLSNPSFDATEISTVTKIMNSFEALETLQQAVYSLFDLRLHSDGNLIRNLDRISTVDFYEEICDEVWPFMKVEGAAWHHRFSHLVPYGSKYHAYLVAKAAASIIWKHIFESDPCSRSDNNNNIAKSVMEKQPKIEAKNPKLPRNSTCDISVISQEGQNDPKKSQKAEILAKIFQKRHFSCLVFRVGHSQHLGTGPNRRDAILALYNLNYAEPSKL